MRRRDLQEGELALTTIREVNIFVLKFSLVIRACFNDLHFGTLLTLHFASKLRCLMSWKHKRVSVDIRDVFIVILIGVNVFAQLADHVLVVFVFIKPLQHLLLHFLSITDERLQRV